MMLLEYRSLVSTARLRSGSYHYLFDFRCQYIYFHTIVPIIVPD